MVQPWFPKTFSDSCWDTSSGDFYFEVVGVGVGDVSMLHSEAFILKE